MAALGDRADPCVPTVKPLDVGWGGKATFKGACSCGWEAKTGYAKRDLAQSEALAHVTGQSPKMKTGAGRSGWPSGF